jgi:cytochrome c-type biogenesis protein CcmH/NrfF
VREDVSGLLTSGLSRDEILEQYARIYGTEVLAAPPVRGFGLSAWVLPFVVLVGAAWFLNGLLRRWARAPSPAALPQTQKSADRYAERLEQEIQDA